MIDTHCHIDLFKDPIATVRLADRKLTTCVAVTMLPSHYELAQQHLALFRRVPPALGFHPLRASEARKEVPLFSRLAGSTKFIGEIGLDASFEGRSTFDLQKEVFDEVIRSIPSGAFVTVHSRSAWRETLEILAGRRIRPVCFHYFTGGADAAQEVIAEGHFLSINHKMIEAGSRHRGVAAAVPHDRILAESDGPFLTQTPVAEVAGVYRFFSEIFGTDASRTEELIAENFHKCRTSHVSPPPNTS